MDAFVGAQRDRRLHAVKQMVLARRHRLFDQLDAVGHELVRQPGDVAPAPGLVGVDDQARVGGTAMDGGNPLDIALPRQLELEQLAARGGARIRLHRPRLTEADRIGGQHRLRLWQAERPPHRHPRLLRLEVPQRRVERVARGPGGHQGQQVGAAGPRCDRIGLRLDGGDH